MSGHVVKTKGISIPSIGLGTYTGASDEETAGALTAAVEAGYRHVDTAHAYENEAIIGRSLKRLFDADKVKREDMFIVTKLPQIALRADDVEEYMKRSLVALQLDYVDLYLVHWPCGCLKRTSASGEDDFFPIGVDGDAMIDPTTDHLAIWKKMEEMVDKGLTKSIGLSNFNIRQIQRVLDNARIKPANLQVECHAYLQQDELYDFCRKNGITFTAYSPLGSPGFQTIVEKLSGQTIDVPPLLNDPALKAIAERHKKSVSQVLLRWLNERGMIIIPKSSNSKRIKENIDIFDVKLSDAETNVIKGLNRDIRIFTLSFMKGLSSHPEYPF